LRVCGRQVRLRERLVQAVMRAALVCGLLAAACGILREPEPIDPSAVRGVARAVRRVSLPLGTVATVQLEDMSTATAPDLIGEQRILGLRSLPLRFSVHFDASRIDALHHYRVLVRVIARDQLIYATEPVWVTPTVGSPLVVELAAYAVDTTRAAPAGFRGVAWGGRPPETLVRASGPSGNEQLEIFRSRSAELPPFLDIAVEDEAYSFAAGRCFAGQLRIRGEDSFATLLDTMTRRYGKPDEPRRDVFVWQWPADGIEVTLAHAAKWQHTTITMTNNTVARVRALQAASAPR
jgi:uncharacterized lipoprotein YbaY